MNVFIIILLLVSNLEFSSSFNLLHFNRKRSGRNDISSSSGSKLTKLDSIKNINSINNYETSNILSKSSLIISLTLSLFVNKVNAGETRPPNPQEEKEAIIVIKDALTLTADMAKLAQQKNYDDIAKLFDKKAFTEFENSCSILTRSDKLSQEDRKSLGTIKRYGVVADAIIMIGGIKG